MLQTQSYPTVHRTIGVAGLIRDFDSRKVAPAQPCAP
jgi:hypothetical protein